MPTKFNPRRRRKKAVADESKRLGIRGKAATPQMTPDQARAILAALSGNAQGKAGMTQTVPKGSSSASRVSAGTLGVGSGSELTRTSVASPNRSMSSRVQGVKSGLREGAQVMSPVDIDVLTGKRSPTGVDAAILAASMVPVPGLKQVVKGIKAGAKGAKTAAKVGRTGKPLPEPKRADFPEGKDGNAAFKMAHTNWERANMTPRVRARDDAMRARREAAGVRNGDPARVTESTFKKPKTEAEKKLQAKAERDLRAEASSRVTPGTSTERLMQPSNIGGGSSKARAVTGRGQRQGLSDAELKAAQARDDDRLAALAADRKAESAALKARGDMRPKSGATTPTGPQTKAEAAAKFSKRKPVRSRFKTDSNYQKALDKWTKERDAYRAENPAPKPSYREGGADRLPSRPKNPLASTKSSGTPGLPGKGDVKQSRKWPEEPTIGRGPDNYSTGQPRGAASSTKAALERAPDMLTPGTKNYVPGSLRGEMSALPNAKPGSRVSPAAAEAKISGKQGKFPKKPTKAQREQAARDMEKFRAENKASAGKTKKPSAPKKPSVKTETSKTSPAAADAKITGKQGKFPSKPTKAQREQAARDMEAYKARNASEATKGSSKSASGSTIKGKQGKFPKKPTKAQMAQASREMDSIRARNSASARQATATSARSDRMANAGAARTAREASAAAARADRFTKANAAAASRNASAATARTRVNRNASAANARVQRNAAAARARNDRNATAAVARAERTKKANAASAERATRAASARAQTQAKKLGKPVAKAAVVGTAVGGATAFNKDRKDRKATAEVGAKAANSSGKAANAKAFEDSGRKQNANTRTREGIVDNKGRLISRKEFNERAAFRARFGLDKMTEAQRAEWRKKNADKWKAEVKRREQYRSTSGKKQFGKRALKITDKTKTRRSA